MRRMICAGALAFAMFGLAPHYVTAAGASELTDVQPRINIARIKNVLRLTPEQQAYWPPVEAALRSLVREQVHAEGMIQRISNRVSSSVLDATAIARIGAAARPLVRMLDERQKHDAIALCYEMGLGQVLAALI